MKNIMVYQTISEHNLLPMSEVSLDKNKMNHIVFSVVLYPVPLPTLHFCISFYTNNFVQIGKPLLMIRFQVLSVLEKRSNNAYYCKTLLISHFCQHLNQRM